VYRKLKPGRSADGVQITEAFPRDGAPVYMIRDRDRIYGGIAKLANSIGRSNALYKTYAPVEIEAVRKAVGR
jgi:hypothetical protein